MRAPSHKFTTQLQSIEPQNLRIFIEFRKGLCRQNSLRNTQEPQAGSTPPPSEEHLKDTASQCLAVLDQTLRLPPGLRTPRLTRSSTKPSFRAFSTGWAFIKLAQIEAATLLVFQDFESHFQLLHAPS